MRRSILEAGILKIAIPTDDGVHVSPRLWRASHFMIATVESGSFSIMELRENKSFRRVPSRPVRPGFRDDRYTAVASLLSDCRVVIASSIGSAMRNTLFRWNIDVIITSEYLVDRVIALFALALLIDESKIDPEDEELAEVVYGHLDFDDGFDG